MTLALTALGLTFLAIALALRCAALTHDLRWARWQLDQRTAERDRLRALVVPVRPLMVWTHDPQAEA